ncbi:Set1 complex component spp1 [Madurella mycetomatis]|uniref:Set1 complex component spp1 n=1 Tax=Madurella mycetomatis TaxID=100816 RepID=A0A175W6I1_9PEZI|nr:Set1 complex component spp1 [Madurella mycetomatis]
MAFSTSFFTPDLAAVTGGSHPQQEAGVVEKETPIAMEGGDHNTNLTEDSQHSELPRPETSQPPPPPSSDPITGQPSGDDSNAMVNAAKTVSKKKKGMASVVKPPPKRGRPGQGAAGTAKKAKGGGSKKAKANASSKRTTGGDAGAADGNEDGDSSESDNGPYCLCRGPDDHRFMIACDRCEDWFHGECIGMDKHTGENLVQKYICPNCTDGGRYATRYKKMCSLAGCSNPARIYDSARPSIFCSAEHCQAWWEQLIATLPRSKGSSAGSNADVLTQEEFMGLLDTSPSPSQPPDTPSWKLGQTPFSTPPDFWDLPTSHQSALTPEERHLLSQSATHRYQLGEEIVLCKKMLQLIDMALKRREAAIAAGRGTAKDLCGYDFRLDTVGTTHQFALFIQSPHGEAIFKAGRLDPPSSSPSSSSSPQDMMSNGATAAEEGGDDPLTAGMCAKKKCKPHNGWSAILTKTVKHDMKELAAQAKEKLDAEQRIRDGAAVRFRRKMKERNGVIVYGDDMGSEEMDVDNA